MAAHSPPPSRLAALTHPSALQRLLLVTVLFAATFAALRVVLAYRALELGASAAQIGILAAAFSFLPMFVAVSSGRVIDRRGARGMLVVGLSLTVVATAGAVFAPGLVLLGIAHVVLGLGQLWLTIASQSMVTELVPESRFTAGFASLTLLVSVGQAAGTPLIGLVLGGVAAGGFGSSGSGGADPAGAAGAASAASGVAAHTIPALWVCFVVLLIALPFAFSLPRRADEGRSKADAAAEKAKRLPAWTLLRRPGMAAAALSSLVVLAGIELIISYLPVIGEATGMSPLAVSILVAVRPLASIVSRLWLPQLVDRFNPAWMLVGNPLLTTPALFVLAFVHSPWVMAPLLALIGFWWGLAQPLTMTWVTRIAPARDRSTALSMRLTANRLGQVSVPVAAGALAGALGPGSVFAVVGVLSGLSLATMSRSLRRELRAGLGREAWDSGGGRSESGAEPGSEANSTAGPEPKG